MPKIIVINRCWDCKYLKVNEQDTYVCKINDDVIFTDVMRAIPDFCELKDA